MSEKKPTYKELHKKLAEAEALITSLRGFAPDTSGTELHIAEGERNIAENERDIAEGERNIAEVERYAAAEDKPAVAEIKRDVAEIKRVVAEDKRDAAEDKRDVAEDKRDTVLVDSREMKEAYIESEQNFRNSLDACPLGVRIVTEDGELIYANQAILDICGCGSVEELNTIPREQFYTPESYANHQERREKRKRGEPVPPEYEISIRRSDGAVRHLQVFRNEVVWGGERQFLAMYRDITERKQAEEALRRSEEKIRSVVELIPDGIVTIDKSGFITTASKAVFQITGFSEEELVGKHISKVPVLSFKDVPKALAVFGSIIIGKGPVRVEIPCRKKDGTPRIGEFRVSLMKTMGETTGIQVIARDITERKKAQEALKESEERWYSIFINSPISIGIATLGGKIVLANDTMQTVTGYPINELKEISINELYENPADRNQLVQILNRDNRATNFTTRLKRKDGTVYDVLLNMARIRLKGEDLLQTTIIDITERKKAEEALKESEKNNRLLADYYMRLNNISITFSEAVDTADLFEKIAESFRLLTGAIASSFAAYDQEARVLKVMSLSIDPISRDSVISMLGTDIFKMRIPISTDDIEQMLTQRIRRPKDLHDLSHGVLPKDISDSVMDAVECQQIVTLAISYAGEIMGTGVAYLRGDQPVVPDEALKTYIYLSGLAIKRKKAEEALLESEGRFRALFETMAQGVVYQDGSGKIISANPAAERILGLTLSQMQGRMSVDPRWKSLHEDGTDFPGDQHPSMIALLTGKPVNNVIMGVYNPVLDEYRWILVNAIPEFTENESVPFRSYTTFTDITERKQAEEALQKSNKLLNDTGEMAKVGGWELDLSTKEVFWTKEVCRIHAVEPGYKPTLEEALDFYVPESRPGVAAVVKRAAETGEPYNLESLIIPRGSKDKTWVLSIGRAIYSGGKIVKLAGTFQDITERKQAEERINHLVLTLNSIRNVNRLITKEKDRDRLIKGICDSMVASRSFESAWIVLLDGSQKLIDWAAANGGGNIPPLIELFRQGNPPRCAQKALTQKQAVITVDPNITCPGCPMLGGVNIGSITIRLEIEGVVYGVLSASMQRSLLSDKNETSLFTEVATDIAFALRDIELGTVYELMEQERLRAAKLESIGTLAGGIAHDFNNLLTGIMGNIGLAKTSIQPLDPAFEMLDEAEKAAVRAKDLTQQLLTFARGGKPVKKLVNIAALIKETAAFALRGSNVRFDLSLPDDLWSLEADEGQIGQVINNLVINADEAMPSGGTLTIEAVNRVMDKTSGLPISKGNYVRIDIKDTGLGISQEHLQRIFEPYFTTKQRGSGLGLTTAYSIVRGHGGYIIAESRLNKGSTFHIYLPAQKKVVKGGGKVEKADSIQAGGKVLVMDDEEIIRKMLNNMLSLAGYEVELSADGKEALEKYRQAMKAGNPFDVVIMDLTIPGGMGGKEAVKKLLEIDPQAAVIVSSGYATDAIMSEYKKYGFKAVIAKPYSVKQLQATLNGLPKRRSK